MIAKSIKFQSGLIPVDFNPYKRGLQFITTMLYGCSLIIEKSACKLWPSRDFISVIPLMVFILISSSALEKLNRKILMA